MWTLAEMCSCLMSKWLVSLFASQIVKLDIKFYEREAASRPQSPIPDLESRVSSVLLALSSSCVGFTQTRTLTHSDTHNRGGRHRGEFVLQMVACFWSRHKFWRLTSSGSWSWSGKSKSWGRIAQNGEDERRRRHFVCGYKSFMQVALAVCVEIKI